jgi:hypothetical protein
MAKDITLKLQYRAAAAITLSRTIGDIGGMPWPAAAIFNFKTSRIGAT